MPSGFVQTNVDSALGVDTFNVAPTHNGELAVIVGSAPNAVALYVTSTASDREHPDVDVTVTL